MIGISTVWKSGKMKDGRELMEYFSKLGFKNIELEYRISDKTYKQIREFLKENEDIKISSIHNFFPIPEITESGGADVFPPSSEDSDIRALSVKYTIKTMEVAAELGARVVVLHLGMVPMGSVMEDFFMLYDKGLVGTDKYRKVLDEFKVLREKEKGKSFDMLLLTMEELIKAAEKLDVYLGIENRYSFREYPNFEEIGVLFEKFGSDRIGYWHDVGHAKVLENLKIHTPEQLLEAYGKYLLGVHIHDVTGYKDHCVPGAGEMDFNILKRYFKKDTIKVLEIHPRETEKDLMEGVDFLKSIGLGCL